MGQDVIVDESSRDAKPYRTSEEIAIQRLARITRLVVRLKRELDRIEDEVLNTRYPSSITRDVRVALDDALYGDERCRWCGRSQWPWE